MSFNAPDFYLVANDLLKRSERDGPYLRTVISRAYYGALIAARDANNISTRGSASGHQAVINSYLGNSHNKVIADNLRDLRKLREHADYEPTTHLIKGDALSAVAKAKKVLSLLNQLPVSPATKVLGAEVPPLA